MDVPVPSDENKKTMKCSLKGRLQLKNVSREKSTESKEKRYSDDNDSTPQTKKTKIDDVQVKLYFSNYPFS